MEKFQRFSFFIILISESSYMEEIIRNIGPLNVKKNSRLDVSYAFTEVTTPTVYQCAQLCQGFARCRSLNFNLKSNTCQLNALSYNDINWDYTNEGYLYVDREDIPKEYGGACADTVCSDDAICINQRGKPFCFPIFKGKMCPALVLPSYVTANVESAAVVGTVAIMLCSSPLRGSHASICQQNGKWSRDSPVCTPDLCESVSLVDPNYASGVKRIMILNSDNGGYNIISVFCDAKLDGGNWMVIQRHVDASFSFNKTWGEYDHGFGDAASNFWIGNKYLYLLTKRYQMELRVEFRVKGKTTTFYGKYNNFGIASATDGYRLQVGNFMTGNCGDGLSAQNGMDFSTWDKNKNTCSANRGGGWWYDSGCSGTNLNAGLTGNFSRWLCFQTVPCLTNIEYTAMMVRKQV